MKKIIAIFCFVFLTFAGLSVGNTVKAVQKVEDIKEASINMDELTYVDTNSFVEYLNNTFEYDFSILYSDTNYYDDFLSMEVEESSCITGLNENGEEIMAFTMVYNEGKLIDFSITVNVYKEDNFEKYAPYILKMFERMADTEFASKYFEYNKYSKNIYNNKEYSFSKNDFYGLGVIFKNGKDYTFDGTTYYFVATIY